MNLKASILLFIVITLLSGCNIIPSGSNIPENMSKNYYKMFVESYELYEERVQKYNGQFVDAEGEIIDFSEEGLFKDSDILEVAWEDRKRKENGEEGLLTEKEKQLKSDFLSLYMIKQLDFLTEELKEMAIESNPEYVDPIQAAINLEEKIINILELEKKPVTAKLQTEDNMTNNIDSTETVTDMQGPREQTEEEYQETAYEVQGYIVNLANNLTIIENMSSGLQSITTNSSIYSDEALGGRSTIVQEIEKKADLMIQACNDIKEQKAPANTEYLVLDPGFKNFADEYLSIVEDLKTTINDEASDITTQWNRDLQILNSDINELESSLGISIGANNYKEYDALLSVWREGKQFNEYKDTHVVIAGGIDSGMRDSGFDFRKDVNN